MGKKITFGSASVCFTGKGPPFKSVLSLDKDSRIRELFGEVAVCTTDDCGCVFSLEENDRVHFDDKGEISVWYVRCPNCVHYVKIFECCSEGSDPEKVHFHAE